MERHCGRFFFVEDYSDSDSDLDSVSDSDLEERDLEDEENEIIDDVTLLTFTNVLWRAKEITMGQENKKWSERKRLKRCTKTLICTKQCSEVLKAQIRRPDIYSFQNLLLKRP